MKLQGRPASKETPTAVHASSGLPAKYQGAKPPTAVKPASAGSSKDAAHNAAQGKGPAPSPPAVTSTSSRDVGSLKRTRGGSTDTSAAAAPASARPMSSPASPMRLAPAATGARPASARVVSVPALAMAAAAPASAPAMASPAAEAPAIASARESATDTATDGDGESEISLEQRARDFSFVSPIRLRMGWRQNGELEKKTEKLERLLDVMRPIQQQLSSRFSAPTGVAKSKAAMRNTFDDTVARRSNHRFALFYGNLSICAHGTFSLLVAGPEV